MKLHLPLKLRNAVLSLVYPILTLAAGVMPLAMAAETITYDGSEQVMESKGSGDTSGNDYVLINGVRFVLGSHLSSGMFLADGNNVGTIWVGNATMVFDDADTSPIYFNNGASTTLGTGGYTIRVMDDAARIRVGSNQFLTIAELSGVAGSQSTEAAYHDVTIQGNARGIMINQASALNNLNITGGIVTLGNTSAAMTGAVHGTLTVGGKSHVTLASNNILAEKASGIVVTSDLALGSTTQTLYDGMSVELKNGAVEGMIGSSVPGQGLVVNDDAKVLLSYSGKSNSVSVDIAVNAGASLTVNNVGSGIYTDNGLVLSGSLSGTGELYIGAAEGMGMGSVTLAGDNTGYTGNVTLNDGSVLTIGHKNALSGAESVTVGRGAYIYEQVGHVDLNNLIIHDGATFVLQDVSTSYEVSSANAAFSVDALRFVEGNKEGYGLMFDNTLDTMEVITLVYSDTAIDNLDLSKFLIYDKDASGKQHKLEAGEYSLGVRKMADGYAFYMVTLFGNIWNGGEGGNGSWSGSSNWEGHAYDASEYNYAIFTNKSGVAESVVDLKGETVSPERLYIFNPLDNGQQTDYVLKNGTVAGGAEIHKRGDNVGDVISSVRFEGVTGGSKDNALGWVTVSGGRMELTNGSTFYFDGSKMVQVDVDSALTIDTSSKLIARNGNTISGVSGHPVTKGLPAYLSGLKISDDTILGGISAGYDTVVQNASISGFTIKDVKLAGAGTIHNGRLEDVVLAENADWYLTGNIAISDTLKVDGNGSGVYIEFAWGNCSLDFGGVEYTKEGDVYTFDVIQGVGNVYGFSPNILSYNGVKLSDLNGAKLTVGSSGENCGRVTLDLSATGMKIVSWDSAWTASGVGAQPTFAKTFSTGSSTAFVGDDNYKSFISTEEKPVTVVSVERSAKGEVLAGGTAGYQGDIWITDDGSTYTTKVAALYRTTEELTGDSHLQIAGGSGTDVYGSSVGADRMNKANHTGDTYVTIKGGSYTNVYGGGSNVNHTGDTRVYVYDGATVTNVYGGSAGTSTDNGLAELFLEGGTITNVYGAGADSATFTGRTFVTDTDLSGVKISAGDTVSSIIHLGANVKGLSLLDGDAVSDRSGSSSSGASANHPNGKHILHFMDAALYDFVTGDYATQKGITIRDFTDIVLAEGAHVKTYHAYGTVKGEGIKLDGGAFELNETLTVSGKGKLELTGIVKAKSDDKEFHTERTIYLEDNATLIFNTPYLDLWAAANMTPTNIVHVSDGCTLETTGNPPKTTGANVHLHAYLEGDGVDGKGAWYKGATTAVDDGSHAEMGRITLTNDASAGGEGTMYMDAYGYTNSVLDLTNGTVHYTSSTKTDGGLTRYESRYTGITAGDSNYTFTKVGTSMLGLKNTHVEGGTLNILDGSVNVTAIVDGDALEDYCSATRTDVVLGKLGTLVLDYMTGDGYNQFNVASLAGEGAVQLQEHGSLNIIVNKTAFYSEFLNDQSISYYNESGYGYAVYSGAITSEMGGLVSKAGAGTQYFTGSESTYGSSVSAASGYTGTWITRGTLYLLGTSTASVFERGLTGVEKGVAGVGTIYWYEGAKTPEVGTLYLGNGVRIYNSGAVTLGTTTYSAWQNGLDVGKDGVVDMTIGVEAAPNGEKLGQKNADKFKYLMMQEDPATGQFNKFTITRGGEEYVQINTANLSSISIDGMYMDGTTYVAGSEIDRNKMLLIKNSVWNNGDVDATVTGLNTAGYNEATYSGVLSDGVSGDGKTVKAKLVKVGGGTLTIDQKNEYTGGTDVKEGSLKLMGWATVGANEATNKVNMLQDDGSSIMLAYDNSYTNEQRSIVNDMVIKGRGDRRWDNNQTEGTDGETAALISDVGLGVDFLLDGAISGAGNLLHSGEGTLTLNGMSDYTLGTIITRSMVTVTSANGLGATAEGKSAALKLYEAATLRFMVGGENPDTHEALAVRGVNDRIDHFVARGDAKLNAGISLWMITELAAVVTDSYSGNSILGTIEIAGTDGVERVLAMTGNGYWATETVLSNYNGTLLFADEAATNKSLVSMYAANGTGYDGAGVITGLGTVAVSDIDTEGEADKDDTTYAWFDEMENFTGSVVVEGTGAALEVGAVTVTDSYSWSVAGKARTSDHAYVVSSGVTGDRGQVSVSGRGASFTAHGADIIVESGSSMNLTSNGHVQDVTYGESFDISDVAAVVAPTVTISGGASFSVTNGATDYQYQITDLQNQNVVTPQDVLNPKLNGYDGLARGANVGFDGAEGYSYHYDQSRALNQTSVGAVGNVNADGTVLGGDLAFLGGSTYKAVMGNTNLCGGSLTLDVSGGLINLDIKLDGDFAEVAMANDRKVQIVLFTGVDEVTFFGVGEKEQYTLDKEAQNAVYYTMAENYFSSPYINSDNVVYLVYDSSAGIVYLDIRVPEPTTTTLGILALAALAARRRRK